MLRVWTWDRGYSCIFLNENFEIIFNNAWCSLLGWYIFLNHMFTHTPQTFNESKCMSKKKLHKIFTRFLLSQCHTRVADNISMHITSNQFRLQIISSYKSFFFLTYWKEMGWWNSKYLQIKKANFKARIFIEIIHLDWLICMFKWALTGTITFTFSAKIPRVYRLPKYSIHTWYIYINSLLYNEKKRTKSRIFSD